METTAAAAVESIFRRVIAGKVLLFSESAMIRAPYSLNCGQAMQGVASTLHGCCEQILVPDECEPYQDYVKVIMLSGDQIRMARAALKWGVRDLASRANITPATVTRIEAGRSGYAATLESIRGAFEAAGIEFIPENGGGVGVRFSKPKA